MAGRPRAPRRRSPELDWDELAALAGDPSAGEPAALARVVRAVCATIAARHPGRSIELRVPPLAAVQLGLDDAGAHKRGTPPNVVELDPGTLLRLAAGTLTWEQARAARLVSASGVRSDLGPVFPLPRQDTSASRVSISRRSSAASSG